MLVHAVYFTLLDDSDESQKEFIALCEEYLSGHDGTVYFGVGLRGSEFQRPVNDQDYDVGLFVVFEDRAAHDKYQQDPRHIEFIEQGKLRWKRVRVFDSYLSVKLKGQESASAE